ncbi:MAG: hypothetical protein AB8I69_03430 [Anaerolineae bacterium]
MLISHPGIDDLEEFLFAVLQCLGGPPRLLFATPLFVLRLLALAFEFRLALLLCDTPCDFEGSFLLLPDDVSGYGPERSRVGFSRHYLL